MSRQAEEGSLPVVTSKDFREEGGTRVCVRIIVKIQMLTQDTIESYSQKEAMSSALMSTPAASPDAGACMNMFIQADPEVRSACKSSCVE